jgi:hypothetical protein
MRLRPTRKSDDLQDLGPTQSSDSPTPLESGSSDLTFMMTPFPDAVLWLRVPFLGHQLTTLSQILVIFRNLSMYATAAWLVVFKVEKQTSKILHEFIWPTIRRLQYRD